MERTLVIGDIHGGYKALKQAVQRAKVTTEDTLIFLGDYVDGWSESVEVVRYLMRLQQSQTCVFLKGNHESLCMEWMERGGDNPLWRRHGGEATIQSYAKVSEDEKQKHLKFFKQLRLYHIDTKNRLFVHAGFTNQKGVKAEYFEEYLCWDRTLWEMAISMPENMAREDPYYPERLKVYKDIFIGHTPVTRYGKEVPIRAANVWNLDTGAAYTGRVSIMDVDTEEFWQSDRVLDLYPDEKGRNA